MRTEKKEKPSTLRNMRCSKIYGIREWPASQIEEQTSIKKEIEEKKSNKQAQTSRIIIIDMITNILQQ